MLTIIELAQRADGGHGLQSQSHRTQCWLEGWVAVPPDLEEQVWACRGYCDLVLTDGALTGLTPREPPAPESEPPTEVEQLRADVDFLAIMTGVTL